MTVDRFLEVFTQMTFVVIFLAVLPAAVRQPRSANINIALLFGALAVIIVVGWIFQWFDSTQDHITRAVITTLLIALPYFLLRLVADFARVPPLLLRGAEAGLVFQSICFFVYAPDPRWPDWISLLAVVYFTGLTVYAAVIFFWETRQTSGVTRRRMQAVALGSLFLGLVIFVAGVQTLAPALGGVGTVALQRAFSLASGVAFFLGFAPPALLRRAWQEPDLRAFLSRVAGLPQLPDTPAIVRELERGAAVAVGGSDAGLGVWDVNAGALRYTRNSGHFYVPAEKGVSGRVFASQQAVFSADPARDDPEYAEVYRTYGVGAMMAAPITAGDRRLGVLVVYAPRPPIFVDDDLKLVRLLADQAAVVLESRRLLEEAARVQAREEAARLKDDFLSAAAHDLKTPLTTVVGQAQLLERRARLNPAAPPDLAGIQRIVRESKRLNSLVMEMLDAARADQGKLLGTLETANLAELAAEACATITSDRHQCSVEAATPVLGEFDRNRMLQLLQNLVENAVKYSPHGGEVRVQVWQDQGEARLTVTDYGIGIPATDLPHIFDRFHRGTNVDDRRFAGMGLGLYICRRIVEQHGGRIWATSEPGCGSTFHVALPLRYGGQYGK